MLSNNKVYWITFKVYNVTLMWFKVALESVWHGHMKFI